MLFVCYPKCSTCQKAKKWLIENGFEIEERHIVEQNPTYEELKKWQEMGNLPIRKMINTSGMLYKQMQLKEKLNDMSNDEILHLLSTNGMLVKRPILVGNDFVFFGFREAEYNSIKKD